MKRICIAIIFFNIFFINYCNRDSDYFCFLDKTECPADFDLSNEADNADEPGVSESYESCYGAINNSIRHRSIDGYISAVRLAEYCGINTDNSDEKMNIYLLMAEAGFFTVAWLIQNNYLCYADYVEKVKKACDSMNEINPDNSDTLIALSMYSLLINDYVRAGDAIIQAKSRSAQDNAFIEYLLWLNFQSDMNSEQYINKSLALDPDFFPTLLEKANIYAGKLDFKSAKIYLERAANQAPRSPDILYNFGVISFHSSDYDEAEDYFKRTLAIEPYYRLAECALNKIDE